MTKTSAIVRLNPSRAPQLETPQHLFQAACYQGLDGRWYDRFELAASTAGPECRVLASSILSILCFSQVCGNDTLLDGISRQPWLSSISADGSVLPTQILAHGFNAASPEIVGQELLKRLDSEAERVCAGFPQVYLLLSGGLDSRIIAGVVARLHKRGLLGNPPVAVTWGFAKSRDACYARKIAEHYGFEWINIPFGPEEVRENITTTALQLGCLHSPEMLHFMTWFERLDPNALVLAGSFGDSIGRAEFAGLHLLELQRFKPSDPFSLLRPEVRWASIDAVSRHIAALESRAPGTPRHARLEHYMQGYRMRGNLCHALGIINRYATIYQMFTDPEVYGYMWSLHPSYRTDDVYAALLGQLDPFLAALPWARSNKAVKGETLGADRNLLPAYHDYTGWSAGPLREHLEQLVDPDWFEAQGIFDPSAIVRMRASVANATTRVGRLNDVWLWLAGFRVFIDTQLANCKVGYEVPSAAQDTQDVGRRPKASRILTPVAQTLQRSELATRVLKDLRARYRKHRRRRLQAEAIRQFPPVVAVPAGDS